MMNLLDVITKSIRFGEENAVKCTELESITGLESRDVKRCIETLRRSGVVICSSSNGYFFPETRAELRTFIHREAARAHSIEITLRSAERLLETWGGDNL